MGYKSGSIQSFGIPLFPIRNEAEEVDEEALKAEDQLANRHRLANPTDSQGVYSANPTFARSEPFAISSATLCETFTFTLKVLRPCSIEALTGSRFLAIIPLTKPFPLETQTPRPISCTDLLVFPSSTSPPSRRPGQSG